MDDPFDAPPAIGKNGRPASPVKRDRYGRPVLPDIPADITSAPDMSTAVGRTTVSTLADQVCDFYGLNRWLRGMAVAGVARDRGIHAQACALNPADKDHVKDLMNLADQAIDRVPEANEGRGHGTALHAFTHEINEGREPRNVPDHLAGDVQAYRIGLAELGITIDPLYCEKMIFCPELNAAGTIDGIAKHPLWRQPRIADLKSTQDLRNGMKETVQLAIYSRGAAIWNPLTNRYERMPAVDQDVAFIPGLPALQGRLDPWDVPIGNDDGWRLARVAYQLHIDRKRQWVTPYETPADAQLAAPGFRWEDQIGQALTRADLSRIWQAYVAAGNTWAGPVRELAEAKAREIVAAGGQLTVPTGIKDLVPVS
jgi:hypothetical protein